MTVMGSSGTQLHNIFLKTPYLFVCLFVYLFIGVGLYMKIRGKLAGVGFLFLPCGSQGWNSGNWDGRYLYLQRDLSSPMTLL